MYFDSHTQESRECSKVAVSCAFVPEHVGGVSGSRPILRPRRLLFHFAFQDPDLEIRTPPSRIFAGRPGTWSVCLPGPRSGLSLRHLYAISRWPTRTRSDPAARLSSPPFPRCRLLRRRGTRRRRHPPPRTPPGMPPPGGTTTTTGRGCRGCRCPRDGTRNGTNSRRSITSWISGRIRPRPRGMTPACPRWRRSRRVSRPSRRSVRPRRRRRRGRGSRRRRLGCRRPWRGPRTQRRRRTRSRRRDRATRPPRRPSKKPRPRSSSCRTASTSPSARSTSNQLASRRAGSEQQGALLLPLRLPPTPLPPLQPPRTTAQPQRQPIPPETPQTPNRPRPTPNPGSPPRTSRPARWPRRVPLPPPYLPRCSPPSG